MVQRNEHRLEVFIPQVANNTTWKTSAYPWPVACLKELALHFVLNRLCRHTLSIVFLAALLPAWAQEAWTVDSLIGTWPVRQRLEETKSRDRASSNVVTTTLYEDLKRATPALPVFIDPVVDGYVTRFSSTRRDHFRALLGAGEEYLPAIETELAKHGIPNELKFLPMAVSAMNPQASSNTGEAGLWMLTYPVAKRYGLQVTENIDERRDPVKSTAVAIRYLQDLHTLYGEWPKAVIAFTCGPANLSRAIRRNGGAAEVRDIYPYISASHRDVLPRLIAFTYLSLKAEEADIEAITWRNQEPSDTLRFDSSLVITALTRVVGTRAGRFAALNPTLTGPVVRAGTPFLLPHSEALRFRDLAFVVLEAQSTRPRRPEQITANADSVERLPDGREAILYRIEEGDRMSFIADKFKVPISELRGWNDMQGDSIDVGNTLLIYVAPATRKAYEGTVSSTKADSTVVTTPSLLIPERPKPPVQRSMNSEFTWYTVKSGDSLYMIAKRYTGVSAEDLMRYNAIDAGIRPGQRIKIPKQ